MKTFYQCLVMFSVVTYMTACGTLPDKEQAYKESSEIQPLEIPPDLTTSSIEDPIMVTPGNTAIPENLEVQAIDISDLPSDTTTDSDLVQEDQAEPAYLEIGDSFPQAWRLVGKALGRVDAEVFDQNRSIGIYYVLYEDKDAQAAKSSLWSKLTFWRDEAVETEEKEYRVKLLDQGVKTQLMILNETGQPQSQGSGLKLLELVEEKLLETL